MSLVEDMRIDTDRVWRTGIAEAVYAPGKTVAQVLEASRRLLAVDAGAVLVTRCSDEQLEALGEAFPEATLDEIGRVAVLRRQEETPPLGTVAIVTGGTVDLPVAREAGTCVEALGAKCDLLVDRGVAGLHRAIEAAELLRDADVVIAVAGFEGALPSVLGGLIAAPLIGVPTSTGYGAAFEGITALLSMLSSCAPGLAVLGIDNGFGAAVHAVKILRGRRT